MNNKQKLAMINICAAAILEDKQLQYLCGESWADSISVISGVVRNIIDFNMQYRVKPEPEPKKFVPFKGQIGLAGNNPEDLSLHAFSHMTEDKFGCFMDGSLAGYTSSFRYFKPIPNVVQFLPMSELDPNYEGAANLLYANGGISYFVHANDMYNGAMPVGFQLLEE